MTTLYGFCSREKCRDGSQPLAGLTLGSDGYFYGTTVTDGNIGDSAAGTVFKISKSGRLVTLYRFCSQQNCTDGKWPSAALVEGTDGNLYGSTELGGTGLEEYCGGLGCGTVFKITPSGELTTLYSFCTQPRCIDGNEPTAGLVKGTDGNFYGVTTSGGRNIHGGSKGYGTIFQITPEGMLTTLYSFCREGPPCADGEQPFSALAQGTDGAFYGTTTAGGSRENCRNGCGTVFSFSAGLGPFIRTTATFGKVNSTAVILGNNLTGSTAVSFNGTAATTFTVVSDTEISARVPSGATTGVVEVTTPSSTLSSYGAFRVLP